MRGHKRLNTKGKIVFSILVGILVVLLYGLVGNDEKKAEKENNTNVSSIGDSLGILSFTTEPVLTFANTALSQSIVESKNEEREVEREKAVVKQNKIDRKDNVIYLTFDDGPTSVSNELLDILNLYQMKATFFMVGPKIKEQPNVVKRIHKEGFGLALHGMTHEVGKIYNNPFSPTAEMKENQEIIESITGVRTEVSRMPYGTVPYLTESMRYVLDQNGFKVWDWNVDSLDWKFNNAGYVQHTINEIEKMKNAGQTPVVLLHDKKETVKHLPKLLAYLKKQKYQTKILTNDMPPLTFSCDGRCRPVN